MSADLRALAEFVHAQNAEESADAQQELANGYGDRTDCGWTSERVLVECEVKLRIAAMYLGTSDAVRRETAPMRQLIGEAILEAYGDALKAASLPYADQPGYDPAWRP